MEEEEQAHPHPSLPPAEWKVLGFGRCRCGTPVQNVLITTHVPYTKPVSVAPCPRCDKLIPSNLV